MTQPDAFARHCRLKHLTAMLKASHAARLMRKGYDPHQAARLTGYGSVHTMQKAIKQYLHQKSPVPVGAENGAQT
jgi:hypothetical protein